MKRILLLLLLLLLLGGACLSAQVTVVFLRHAERTSKYSNAELTKAGRNRAQRLVAVLDGYRPAALFASDMVRTQRTLEPLARQLGLPLQIYERGRERVLGRVLLERFQGQTVVVCGHSDTLMNLVAALGYGESFPEIGDFDRYWVLRVPAVGSEVSLEERRQGAIPR